MKLIIDIPDYNLNDIQNGSIACGQILKAVKNGKPYEERPQGDSISREALKKSIKSYADDQYAENEYLGEYAIMDIIDNAPTVKPCENCDLYFKAMTKEELREGGAE